MSQPFENGQSDNSLARSRALKEIEKYVPGFHLPPPDPEANKLVIEVVRSDNNGRPLNMTDEEKIAMIEWLNQQRKQEAALLQTDGSMEPDPLDM